MAQYDFDKRLFLRDQYNKSETAMPGLRPYVNLTKFLITIFIKFRHVDQATYGTNRIPSSRMQSSRKDGAALISPSVQSLLSRSGANSDPTFNRRQQSLTRQIKTARPLKAQGDITPTSNSPTPTDQRLPTRQQMARERLNRLAQPKGFRFKSAATDHTRSMASDGQTPEDVFGKIDQVSQVSATPIRDILPNKPKTPADDKRFHHLVNVFSQVHAAEASNSQTVQSIIQANPSLQDEGGEWKIHSSVTDRKAELKHHRQLLADKLHRKIDIFLIDVGA
jgi:hypothetical protein